MAHLPGISLIVNDTLPAYRLLKVSAANTVALLDTITTYPAGVSQNDTVQSSPTGTSLPIGLGAAIQKLEFNETMTAGGLFQTNANGQGVPFVANTAGSYVSGQCLDTVSATGTIARVVFNPHWRLINP